MSSIRAALNNRELAIVIWFGVLLVTALSKRELRASIRGLLGTVLQPKRLWVYAAMLAYVVLAVYILYLVGFWDSSALKDTIFWTFGVAFIMLLNLNKLHNEKPDVGGYLKRTITDNLKLIVLIGFLVKLYPFNFFAELLLVPAVTLLILSQTVDKSKSGFELEARHLQNLTGFFGLVLLTYVAYRVATDIAGVFTLPNLRKFLLPLVLTVMYLPFIYGMALFAQYENIFARLKSATKNPEAYRLAKRKILTHFHIRLWKLHIWSVGRHLRFTSKAELAGLPEHWEGKIRLTYVEDWTEYAERQRTQIEGAGLSREMMLMEVQMLLDSIQGSLPLYQRIQERRRYQMTVENVAEIRRLYSSFIEDGIEVADDEVLVDTLVQVRCKHRLIGDVLSKYEYGEWRKPK